MFSRIEKNCLITILILEAVFFSFHFSKASNPSPIIISETVPENETSPALNYKLLNEFLPNPIGDDKLGEFIELYNPNETAINLYNFILDDQKDDGSKPFIFLDQTIEPSAFLILPYSLTKIILNNDQDTVRFLNSEGEVMEEIEYSNPKEGESYNKFNDIWQWSKITTPNLPNHQSEDDPLPPTEETAPSIKIILNEILPNPIGNDQIGEYIELFNQSDSASNLNYYQLRDQSNNTYAFSPTDSIPKLTYRAFYTGKKISLNNDGDTIYLLFNDQILDQISYPVSTEAKSYNRKKDNTWAWSATLTPNSQNIITQTQIPEITTSPNLYPRHIWLSEFLPNPKGSDTENEFIEIYNAGPNEINLISWFLDDCENQGSRSYQFPKNKIIKVGEYLSFPYQETKISLNNNKDCVRLLWPNEQAIDEVTYNSPPEGASFNKTSNGWRWSLSPTPDEPNLIKIEEKDTTKNNDQISKIIINEVLPNPIGRDIEGEFIELYNPTSETINLNGLKLDDCKDTGSKPHTIQKLSIKPNNFIALYYQTTEINLNNDGDCVRLLDSAEKVINEINYKKSLEGKSYSRLKNNTWQWVSPTPNAINFEPQILDRQTQKITKQSKTSQNPTLPQTGISILAYIKIVILIMISFFTLQSLAKSFQKSYK